MGSQKKDYLERSSQSFRVEEKGPGLCTPHIISQSCERQHAGDSLGQSSFLWLRQVPGRGLAFSCQQSGACVTQSWRGKSVQGPTVPITVTHLDLHPWLPCSSQTVSASLVPLVCQEMASGSSGRQGLPLCPHVSAAPLLVIIRVSVPCQDHSFSPSLLVSWHKDPEESWQQP